MALKATILKVKLSLSDMDRHVYQDFSFTVAQHPSETDQRLMIRILAFALNACEGLEFTKGLCEEDEPELWHVNYSEEIELWIDLGLPDEKRVKKACNRAKKVRLYTYGEGAQETWWQKNSQKLNKMNVLEVFSLPFEATQQLATMISRGMQLSVTIQDGQVWFSDESHSILIESTQLK
ncbi:YaeQ family protein [Pseudoalteromonas denitrificans]|uniref:Uncharacterized conserved protein YaeQ, suppresses RfaH defect n=1 Tax=Pseudoalteromonas denitrificans DSM 6059 TaxID=1123010 RepID=A0A1I1UUK3_9GAMM|nr:YaeQ family protein [Pseudoalteromonas denitrificans]SFD74255.1 Uncharacterized conserved protein YaeQ, suppresses RfaH defect [Pseudoalteromonas denitrificans DSM 6059]